jgi:carboxypeptidase D
MFNKEVSTGKKPSAGCSSTGQASVAAIKNKVPTHPVSECYVWDIFQTCTPAQAQMLRNGTALTKDFIMVGYTSANGTAVYY